MREVSVAGANVAGANVAGAAKAADRRTSETRSASASEDHSEHSESDDSSSDDSDNSSSDDSSSSSSSDERPLKPVFLSKSQRTAPAPAPPPSARKAHTLEKISHINRTLHHEQADDYGVNTDSESDDFQQWEHRQHLRLEAERKRFAEMEGEDTEDTEGDPQPGNADKKAVFYQDYDILKRQMSGDIEKYDKSLLPQKYRK